MSSSSSSSESDDKTRHSRKTSKKAKAKAKRPPGRPRRVPENPPVIVKGIVTEPEDPKNLTELLYYNTTHLKKIAQLFKNIKASSVQIITNEKEMILFAQSPFKNNSVMVVFDGSKMNHYYNKNNLDIGVGAGNLITVLKKINKRHSCVGIMQDKDEKDRWIDIALINGFVGIRSEQSVSLIPKYTKLTDEMRAQFLDESKYSISFEYFQYDFKRLISDSKSFQERIVFRKSGTEPLAIEYNNTDGQIKAKDILDDKNDKLALKSTVQENELFVISVQVEALRAISSASLGDSVKIFLQEKMPLKTIIKVDEGVTVYTQTKLSEKKLKPVADSDSDSDKPRKKNKKKKSEEDEEDSDLGILPTKKKVESESEESEEESD